MRIDAGGFLSLTQIRRSELATSSTKSGGGFTGNQRAQIHVVGVAWGGYFVRRLLCYVYESGYCVTANLDIASSRKAIEERPWHDQEQRTLGQKSRTSG